MEFRAIIKLVVLDGLSPMEIHPKFVKIYKEPAPFSYIKKLTGEVLFLCIMYWTAKSNNHYWKYQESTQHDNDAKSTTYMGYKIKCIYLEIA